MDDKGLVHVSTCGNGTDAMRYLGYVYDFVKRRRDDKVK